MPDVTTDASAQRPGEWPSFATGHKWTQFPGMRRHSCCSDHREGECKPWMKTTSESHAA